MKDPIYIEKKVPFFKRKQILTILIGLFLMSIMILSALEYSLQNSQQEETAVTVSGLEFNPVGTGWQATTNGKTVLISYDPTTLDVGEIPVLNFDPLLSTQKVYFSINPYDNYQLAVRDFQTSFARAYTPSCYEDNDLCAETPLRTCDNATTTTGIIVFREANETVITYENNCLTVQGKDLLKLTDTLILGYYGER